MAQTSSSVPRGSVPKNRRTLGPVPHVFLDRDGVIVRDTEGYIARAEDMAPAEGGVEGCVALARAGFALVVVSNQQGVALGLFGEGELARMEETIQGWLAPHGVRIARFYHATGHRDAEDPMRKPAPGMLLRAGRELGFDPRGCALVGDRESDMAAARAAGARPVLVLTGKTRDRGWHSWEAQPVAVYANLHAASAFLVSPSQ